MDYLKHYTLLIDRAKKRSLHGYYEKHHIIPKCLGGSDNPSNIAKLLPEEHYIAHLLLVKIYPKNSGLIFAANRLCNSNNKQYSWVKRKFSIENSIRHKGLKHTNEAKQKMIDAIANRWKDNEVGFSIEQSRRAKRPKTRKDGYFKQKSENHAKNISTAALNRPKIPCSVCGKLVTKQNINNHKKIHKEY